MSKNPIGGRFGLPLHFQAEFLFKAGLERTRRAIRSPRRGTRHKLEANWKNFPVILLAKSTERKNKKSHATTKIFKPVQFN